MLVSIIIPTYNRAGFISRAVRSVLEQTYAQLEVIVVDDGSTDAIQENLSLFEDARLKLLSQKNQGVSAARNAGLDAARGELLALLDSDDYWLPDKLRFQVQFMLDGNWDICQTDEFWIRDGKLVNPGFKHAKRAGWLFEPSLKLCLVSPSCVLFTRDFWEQMKPFDQGLLACEDYDLWLRSSIYYPTGFLPQKLVVKQGGHADQLSRKIIGLDLYRIYSMIKLLQNNELDTGHKVSVQEVLEQKVKHYVQGCLKRNKPEEAQRIKDMLYKKC